MSLWPRVYFFQSKSRGFHPWGEPTQFGPRGGVRLDQDTYLYNVLMTKLSHRGNPPLGRRGGPGTPSESKKYLPWRFARKTYVFIICCCQNGREKSPEKTILGTFYPQINFRRLAPDLFPWEGFEKKIVSGSNAIEEGAAS